MISSISASIYEEKKPEVDRKLNSARADSTDKYTLKLWAGPRGQLTDEVAMRSFFVSGTLMCGRDPRTCVYTSSE